MNGTIAWNGAQKKQIQLEYAIGRFSFLARIKHQNKKDEKDLNLMSVNGFIQGRKILLNIFKSRMFPRNSSVWPSTSNDDDSDMTLKSEPQSTFPPIKPT